jgi:hypothetical protein
MLQNPQSKLGTYIQDTKYVPYNHCVPNTSPINKIEEQERVQRNKSRCSGEEQERVKPSEEPEPRLEEQQEVIPNEEPEPRLEEQQEVIPE